VLLVRGKEVTDKEIFLHVIGHFDNQEQGDNERVIFPNSIHQYAPRALILTVRDPEIKVSLSWCENI